MPNRVQTESAAGPLVAVLAPIAIAFALTSFFLFGMPYMDDYDTVVRFALTYVHLPTLGARLLFLLESQHMEYKFVFEHALVALDLGLTGHLHFVALQVIGNLFLLAILGLVWRFFALEGVGLRQRLVVFVPVPLLFMALNYSEAVNFPSATLDYLPAIFFSFAALGLLAKVPAATGRGFALACGCALLAYASAVNAFWIGPIGFFLLLRDRRWGRAALWVGTGLLGLTPYLYRYAPMVHTGAHHPLKLVLFFVCFLGAGAPWRIMIPVGFISLGVFGWGLRTGFARTHGPSFWCWIWIMCSAAMTAVGRSSDWAGYGMAPRYMMFSDLVLIFCYQVCVSRQLAKPELAPSWRVFYRVSVAVAVLFFLRADYYGIRDLRVRQKAFLTGLHDYRAAPESQSPMYMIPPDPVWLVTEERARKSTHEAIAEGLFQLPNR